MCMFNDVYCAAAWRSKKNETLIVDCKLKEVQKGFSGKHWFREREKSKTAAADKWDANSEISQSHPSYRESLFHLPPTSAEHENVVSVAAKWHS